MAVEQFLTDIWGTTEGTVCLSFKNGAGFKDEFFRWPGSITAIEQRIADGQVSSDVYCVPAVLRGNSRKKIAFKGSNVAWVDLDKGLPEFSLAPSVLVETSPGHYHAYWKLDQLLSSSHELEQINKNLAHSFGADLSGWDATQLLRVPFTINHKRGTPVVLVSRSAISYPVGSFPKVQAPQLMGLLL